MHGSKPLQYSDDDDDESEGEAPSSESGAVYTDWQVPIIVIQNFSFNDLFFTYCRPPLLVVLKSMLRQYFCV